MGKITKTAKGVLTEVKQRAEEALNNERGNVIIGILWSVILVGILVVSVAPEARAVAVDLTGTIGNYFKTTVNNFLS